MSGALPHRSRLAVLLMLLAALVVEACRAPRAEPERTSHTLRAPEPAPAPRAEPAPRAPNVLVILADDLGWGELGCYGQAKIRTPVIDTLALQGMRFTQAYAGAPASAPSRCALLTGLHTGHAAIRDDEELEPEGQAPLPAGVPTIATLLKERGYATALIGTWGLGPSGSEGDPACHGFERFFGQICLRAAHGFHPPFLYRDRERIALEGNDGKRLANGAYAPDLLREEALGFLRANAARPFLLVFSTPLPHAALDVPEDSLVEYAGAFEEKPYDGSQGGLAHPKPRAAHAAMIARMDRDVGALLAELERLGVARDTLVILTSDHGASSEGGVDTRFFASNAGLRGQKGQLFEGGIRTPLIVRWPGHVRAASVSSFPCASWDLLPTLAEICSAAAPAGGDGVSLLPVLTGNGEPTRDLLYWEYPGNGGWWAVRMGDWKAVRRNLKKNIPGAIELYDLAQDPGEKRDVARERPELVRRALTAFAARTESPVAEWNFTPPK